MPNITYYTEIDGNGKETLFKTDLEPPEDLENSQIKISFSCNQNFLAVNHPNPVVEAIWHDKPMTASFSPYRFKNKTWFYPSELAEEINKIFFEDVIHFKKRDDKVIVTCLSDDLSSLSLGYYFMNSLGLEETLDFTHRKRHVGKPIHQSGYSYFEISNNFSTCPGRYTTQPVENKINFCKQMQPLYGEENVKKPFQFQIIPPGADQPFAYKGRMRITVRIADKSVQID